MSVLFHLTETHMLTHALHLCTVGARCPGGGWITLPMPHFKEQLCLKEVQGLPVGGCVGLTVQTPILTVHRYDSAVYRRACAEWVKGMCPHV